MNRKHKRWHENILRDWVSLTDEQVHERLINPYIELSDEYQFGFDDEFMSKLKTFFSMSDKGCRRTGRTTLLARILLEEAIESGNKTVMIDHHLDAERGTRIIYHLQEAIQEWVEWYRERDVDICIEFTNRNVPEFRARLLPMIHDKYHHLRIKPHYINTAANPFPVDKLKAQLKKVLDEQLLLINFDD